jgi:amino-acid N-acetyltransferase
MTGEETGGVPIRPAEPDDWPAIRRLVTAAGLPLDGLTDSDLVLVAVRDDRIVGTAALERHGDGDATAYLLRSVAVAESERRSGIGTRLVHASLSTIRPGAPVALLTETAASYFPRFGFVPVDRDRLPASLAASPELRGACPASAQALLRHPTRER